MSRLIDIARAAFGDPAIDIIFAVDQLTYERIGLFNYFEPLAVEDTKTVAVIVGALTFGALSH